MVKQRVIVLSGAEKNDLIDENLDVIRIIDNFRSLRIVIKSCSSILISVISFFTIILLVLYFSTVEKLIYDAIGELQENKVNTNREVNTCFMGITSPCLANGLVNPIPIVQLQNIYTNQESNLFLLS
jgi:hypothetical protein